jgi:hypothetical protein
MGLAISGYGMYLNSDELDDFITSVAHDADEEYAYGIESATDLFQWFDVTLLNYDEMWDGWSVRFIYDDMNEDHIELTGAFFFTQKQGSIIAGSDQLYSSIDDIVNEMREEYGKYLPEKFNYGRHIAFMCGYVTN